MNLRNLGLVIAASTFKRHLPKLGNGDDTTLYSIIYMYMVSVQRQADWNIGFGVVDSVLRGSLRGAWGYKSAQRIGRGKERKREEKPTSVYSHLPNRKRARDRHPMNCTSFLSRSLQLHEKLGNHAPFHLHVCETRNPLEPICGEKD